MDKRKPLMTRKTKAAMADYADDSPAEKAEAKAEATAGGKRKMKMERKEEPMLTCPKCDRMLVDNEENRAYCASKS
jgi:hypothetical protein